MFINCLPILSTLFSCPVTSMINTLSTMPAFLRPEVDQRRPAIILDADPGCLCAWSSESAEDNLVVFLCDCMDLIPLFKANSVEICGKKHATLGVQRTEDPPKRACQWVPGKQLQLLLPLSWATQWEKFNTISSKNAEKFDYSGFQVVRICEDNLPLAFFTVVLASWDVFFQWRADMAIPSCEIQLMWSPNTPEEASDQPGVWRWIKSCRPAWPIGHVNLNPGCRWGKFCRDIYISAEAAFVGTHCSPRNASQKSVVAQVGPVKSEHGYGPLRIPG